MTERVYDDKLLEEFEIEDLNELDEQQLKVLTALVEGNYKTEGFLPGGNEDMGFRDCDYIGFNPLMITLLYDSFSDLNTRVFVEGMTIQRNENSSDFECDGKELPEIICYWLEENIKWYSGENPNYGMEEYTNAWLRETSSDEIAEMLRGREYYL